MIRRHRSPRQPAATLLDIEPHLRTVCDHQDLTRLRSILQTHRKGRLEEVA